MREAIIKMQNALALTIQLKSLEGQKHGFFSERNHRAEFTAYTEAAELVYALYVSIKFEKSAQALLAFADATCEWAVQIEARLWEILDINKNFKYFLPEDVGHVYESIFLMNEDLLQVLFPDAVNQVHTILIDSQNNTP